MTVSALPALMKMKSGTLLDELGAKIATVSSAVGIFQKPGEVILKIKISPYKNNGARLAEQPLVFESEVVMKEPQPERHADLFWPDEDGNPHSKPQRQGELDVTTPRVVAHKE